jgi:hypothetical protein
MVDVEPERLSERMDSYFTGTPLRIGNETQLLIDGTVVEDRWRLPRPMRHPHKFPRNQIIVADKLREAGKPVYLRFELRRTSLYSFRTGKSSGVDMSARTRHNEYKWRGI